MTKAELIEALHAAADAGDEKAAAALVMFGDWLAGRSTPPTLPAGSC